MSFSHFTNPRGRRNTILASVAVAALGVAGALGEGAFAPNSPCLCGGGPDSRSAPERPVLRASHR